MTTVTEAIRYVGVNDHQVDLFEGQYPVPNGMAYNSYVILDEKTAVMDTVDIHFTEEWLKNVAEALGGRKPDYLVIQHMEPDHSASIEAFLKVYPDTTVVATAKAFAMIGQFFDLDLEGRKLVAENGASLSLGSHELHFVFAPMVHWPEVMMTYESTDKVLFSADGFGKFGALDTEEDWDCEARRYYIGIVGKYGAQVQAVREHFHLAWLPQRLECSVHSHQRQLVRRDILFLLIQFFFVHFPILVHEFQTVRKIPFPAAWPLAQSQQIYPYLIHFRSPSLSVITLRGCPFAFLDFQLQPLQE